MADSEDDQKAAQATALPDISDGAREAAAGVREVRDTFADAIDKSLEARPYATLLLAAVGGFLLGAIWRR